MMNDWQDLSAATLTRMTEGECSQWRQRQGAHVIQYGDRYWQEIRPGFYQPIHLLARLSAEQATRPTLWSWGFRAALQEADASAANASIPLHILSNLEEYTLPNLPKKLRWHINKCQKQVKIVALTNAKLLAEQGYDVLRSALMRTQYTKIPSLADYLASLSDYVTPQRFVLAGSIDGRLGGYLTGYAIDHTAYMDDRVIATEALKTDIGSGLTYEFVQVCRRSGIREIVSGQHCREDEALCAFKQKMGFSLKLIPFKVQIQPAIAKLIRWSHPHAYYRLTGED
jgi:Acetyltransferase (GNAT) family